MRRAVALAGVTALAVMGTGAWLPGESAAAEPSPSSSPDLSRYYTQKIKWGACEGDGAGLMAEADATAVPKDKNIQCGKITVPLDYAKPGRGTVKLAMIRIKSSGEPRGSLLLNFGGPGGAGVSGLLNAQKEFEYLGKGYDVVSFDPRGVGESSPVSCGDMAAEEPQMEGDPDDPSAVLDEVRKISEQCKKESGPVLPYIGTVNVSRDMDVMREVLGDKKLNYLGFSYGTRLGAVYTAQFPDKVGRMVLDGVDTLTEDVAEQALVSAEGRQTALDNFIDWCTDNPGCVFGTDSRAARGHMADLIKGLDQYPLQSADGVEFTGQDVVEVLGQSLYSRQSWPALSQALGALMADGDPRALLRMSGSLAQQRPGSGIAGRAPADVPADNMAAALMAVNCADDPDRPSAARLEKEVTKLQREFESTSAIFGRSMLMPVLFCYGRPAGTDYIRDDVRDVKSPDFLLVGTRGDPATPYRWTEETAERLGSSAIVLDNKGDGHTGYAGSKCVRDKVDRFLLYGEMPKTGSSCGVEEED